MDTSARRRSGWSALAVSSVARMLLGVLASLLLWAVAPALGGLHSTVVMTGSMLPRLVPGDVVFSRSVPAADLQLGQTLLYADPDLPGHLRMHRWIGVTDDGLLVTKGDANPERDSTPIDRSAVVGVASLRVPFVARPVVWAADGDVVPLALTGAGLLATLVAAFWFRAAPEPATEDDESTTDDDALASPPDPTTGEQSPRRLRRLVQAGAALLVVVGVGGTFATSADAATARFTRSTANPTSTWNAAAYFSCAGAARVDGTALTYPLDETSGTAANDIGPYNLDGTVTGVSGRVSTGGPCGGRGITLNGSTGQVVTPAAAQTQAPTTFTFEVWFRTAPGYNRGGKVIGFEDSQNSTGSNTDRNVYMTNSGGLVFGLWNGHADIVTSGSTTYNDGNWHLVDAVLSSAGQQLYVDGRLVGQNSQVTTAQDYAGWLRIGGGGFGGGWPSQPTSNFLAGSVAYASAYLTALSATQIAGHYTVGKP